MKTKSIVLIGCSSFILILIGAFIIGYLVGFGPQAKSISGDSWLVLDISGEVPDYNEVRSTGFWSFGNPSLEEMNSKIRGAATDDKIKGIVIKASGTQISYANMSELGLALKEFKATKKPVIAHGVFMAQKDYLLCSMADQIYMDPTASGGLILEGVSANIMFYKEALRKLGIKMHVMQAGEFKGAGEPYTQTSLTPGTEANLRKVLKSRYDMIITDIAKYRKMDTTAVRNVFETRPDLVVHAAEAKKYGFIDQTASWDEVKAKYEITEDKYVSIKDYANETSESFTGNKIAIVNLSGNIAAGQGFGPDAMISASKVDDILESIKKDGNVKAIVLRVNSPGGSATESELIYQKLKRLDMPIVVSMGGVAASGGYYISCAGDYIFADAHTITGSIGVIMTIPEAEELGNKLGIDSQTLSYGKFSGFGSVFEKYDEELLNSLKRNSESVYSEFKQRVMDARKISPEDITSVAEGRVFSAADAKAVKLIDEIGSMDAAVVKAAELAKIKKYHTQQFPQKIGILEMFKQSGFFQMVAKQIKEQNLSLDQRLQTYLERTLQSRQWLYFSPFMLD